MPRSPPTADPEVDTPARLWTVREANARLGDLEELMPRLRAWAHRLGEVHAEIHRLSDFWGADIDAPDHADHERKLQLDQEWKNLTHHLEEAVAALQRDGIEVKDLETGLVDFYGRVGGEVVFLCWRLGEGAVGFYHPLAGGFRARRPLPDERAVPPARTGDPG